MRALLILFFSLTLGACAPFQGPAYKGGSGGLRTPAYTPTGGTGYYDEDEDSDEDEVSTVKYMPSQRGQAKGYHPKHAFALSWPLGTVKINQPFRPNKKRRPHLGVDFAGTKGTPIYAAHEGLVIYAGRAFKGFGRVVIVEYDDQWASLYAHMDKILVKSGQVVARGQSVGRMGRSGRATGVHLHFELLHNQRPIDPLTMLNEGERLVDARSPASER